MFRRVMLILVLIGAIALTFIFPPQNYTPDEMGSVSASHPMRDIILQKGGD